MDFLKEKEKTFKKSQSASALDLKEEKKKNQFYTFFLLSKEFNMTNEDIKIHTYL